MKGAKLLALAVHQNAMTPNASKDHPSGKESRGEIERIRASEQNLLNVLPHLYAGKTPKSRAVTLPMSDRKLALVKRHAGFGARD